MQLLKSKVEVELSKLAVEARKCHGMSTASLWSSVEHRMNAGKCLEKAKELKKGQGWVEWCSQEVGISSKIANAYIKLWRGRHAIAAAQAKIKEEMGDQTLSVMEAYAIAGAKISKSAKPFTNSGDMSSETSDDDDAPGMPEKPVVDEVNAKVTFKKSILRDQLPWLLANSDWLSKKKIVMLEVHEDASTTAA